MKDDLKEKVIKVSLICHAGMLVGHHRVTTVKKPNYFMSCHMTDLHRCDLRWGSLAGMKKFVDRCQPVSPVGLWWTLFGSSLHGADIARRVGGPRRALRGGVVWVGGWWSTVVHAVHFVWVWVIHGFWMGRKSYRCCTLHAHNITLFLRWI